MDAKRAECHRLIDQMLDRGLDETLETLKDCVEFYRTLQDAPPYVPPKPIKCGGKYIGTVERAPLFIDYE